MSWLRRFRERRNAGRVATVAEARETEKREWCAHSPGGKVVLGIHITYAEALTRIAKLGGTVTFTDFDYGLIFFNTDLGQKNSGDSP